MGVSFNINPSSSFAETHSRKHKLLLVSNYILLAAASSFIFLTLSLRLVPSLCGFFLILLHVLTIIVAVTAISVATCSLSSKWYAAHMVTTVLTAIFQGSVSVLIFASTADFLGYLKSYVREEDGVVILKLAGGLSVLIFFLEWVVLALTFLLRYHAFVGGNNGVAASGGGRFQEDDLKGWSRPFQVYA